MEKSVEIIQERRKLLGIRHRKENKRKKAKRRERRREDKLVVIFSGKG